MSEWLIRFIRYQTRTSTDLLVTELHTFKHRSTSYARTLRTHAFTHTHTHARTHAYKPGISKSRSL